MWALSLLSGGWGLVTKLSWKTWLWIIGILMLLAVIITIWANINSHLKHEADLAKANATLSQQNEKLNTDVLNLGKINTANQAVYQASVQQVADAQAIAAKEQSLATARATAYGAIRSAAKDTPTNQRRGVSPVVSDVVNRLWDSPPKAASANGHP
jgi:hypothetical protein